jgi:nitrogen fixation NifU-like protein
MAYSEKVLEYYNNPKNVGSLDKNSKAVGTALVGSPELGHGHNDVMRLQIEVNAATQVISDARFKTFGCGSAIAASSLVTEWLKGKTLQQALQIDNMDIVEALNLPPVKLHCSVLAEEAIRTAVNDYRHKNGLEPLVLEDEVALEAFEEEEEEESESAFH